MVGFEELPDSRVPEGRGGRIGYPIADELGFESGLPVGSANPVEAIPVTLAKPEEPMMPVELEEL